MAGGFGGRVAGVSGATPGPSSGSSSGPPSADADPVEVLSRLIDAGPPAAVADFVDALPPEDTPYTLSHLDDERRTRLFTLLADHRPELGADVLEHFDDVYAADVVGDLAPADAAALVDVMDSDEQADVIGELPEAEAQAILDAMSPEEASDTRRRLRYDEDAAGGLMITEYLHYPDHLTVEAVADDLREHGERYEAFEVRYVYATDERGGLAGTVPMRRLVMARRGTAVRDLMAEYPATVTVDTPVADLEDLFDRIDLSAVPVVDEALRLCGVVQRAAVQEARGEAAEEDLAKVGGIVGGEELRSMPTLRRAGRRMMFLVPIMGLMMVSAAVISLFRDTVERVPLIAAFLPVVAGLCGSGGNQAVAVSMREISLGLIKPADLGRVAVQEAVPALLNGLALGLLLFGVVLAWERDATLALVIGAAVPGTTVVATVIGGGVPLLLRAAKLDPAMASGPVVTTLVDLTAYFSVLVLATWLLVG